MNPDDLKSAMSSLVMPSRPVGAQGDDMMSAETGFGDLIRLDLSTVGERLSTMVATRLGLRAEAIRETLEGFISNFDLKAVVEARLSRIIDTQLGLMVDKYIREALTKTIADVLKDKESELLAVVRESLKERQLPEIARHLAGDMVARDLQSWTDSWYESNRELRAEMRQEVYAVLAKRYKLRRKTQP